MPFASSELLAAPARLQALADTGLLDALPDEAFDRLTRLASRLTGAPQAIVSLVDDRRQVFLSQVGRARPDEREVALSRSFCQHVVARAAPLVVGDATVHPLVHDNLATLEDGVRAYAGMPIREPGGEVLGAFCALDTVPHEWTAPQLEILRDLAATVETEIALRMTLRERDALAQRKDRLMRVVSHELRTPLTGLLGSLRLLAARPTGGDGGLVAIALQSSERMLRLTNDLLDFDTAERGGLSLLTGPVDCHEALATAAGAYEATARAAGITLVHVDGEGTVLADGDRLQQILGNLITNALKFTPPGKAVQLDADELEDTCVLRVRDEGRGIPADQLARVFEPFAQVTRADQTEKKGAGLGLAICKSLVERMGGAIAVTSTEGEGTTFAVTLPRWQP